MSTSAVTFQPAKAVSKTILVPDDYPTITAAIGNATDGDVIYVRNGFYNETALEIDKTLTLKGEDVRNTVVYLDPPLVSYTNVLGQIRWIPSIAIKVNADNVKLSGFTITSPGAISATGDGTEIISNIITIGESYFPINSDIGGGMMSCILSGSHLTVARNTLTGDMWSLTGSNQTLTENVLNGTISSKGDYCLTYGNNISGDLLVKGSFNTITRNSYTTMYLRYGDSNIINCNSGRLSLGNSDSFLYNKP